MRDAIDHAESAIPSVASPPPTVSVCQIAVPLDRPGEEHLPPEANKRRDRRTAENCQDQPDRERMVGHGVEESIGDYRLSPLTSPGDSK